MVGVQTTVGRGFEGVHAPVVELARLHHALPVPVRCLPALRRLRADLLDGDVRPEFPASRPMARRRPDAGLRGRIRHR